MSAITALVKHDRWVIGTGLALSAGLVWWYLIEEAQRMNAGGLCESLGMEMARPEVMAWPIASLVPLFLMWAVMMVAMMLPSAAPMILTFAAVSRHRRRQQRPYVPTIIFVSGYLIIWCGFSGLAAVSQWILHRTALLSPMMASSSNLFAGGLLLAAGLFQFTPLKRNCLRHCRAPLEFIMTRWHEGRAGALCMGLEHGVFCTGCCWALMGLRRGGFARCLVRRLQPIADTGLRKNILRLCGVRFDFVSELPDIDAEILRVNVCGPKFLEKELMGQNLACVLNQKTQQLILLRRKLDLLAAALDDATHEIDRQVAELENWTLALHLELMLERRADARE
jgi:predicted metal-binding membrane protein